MSILHKLSSRSIASISTFSIKSLSVAQCRRFASYYDEDEEGDSRRKTALVLGSSGCLGRTITKHLASKLDMQVIGVDVVNNPDEKALSAFVSMPAWEQHPGVGDVTEALVRGVSDAIGQGEEIDAIICASGGWQGDPAPPAPSASDEECFDGAKNYGQAIDKMLEMNLYPVLAAGYAANRFMAEEGT